MLRTQSLFSAFALAAAVVAASSAAASEVVASNADLDVNLRVQAYVYSPMLQEALSRQATFLDQKFNLSQACKEKRVVTPINVLILAPIELADGADHPTKGAWKVRYRVYRCDTSKVYNGIFEANAQGNGPTLHLYYPGTTNASPVLIKDAWQVAYIAAITRSGVKDCKEPEVYDMKVTQPMHEVTDGARSGRRAWNEDWYFAVCGKTVTVPMVFSPDPDGKGTSFFVQDSVKGS